MQVRLTILIVAVLGMGGFFSKPAACGVVLVEDGRPLGVIVTAEQATPAARLAALELRFHIEEITGATLRIQDAGQPSSGPRILVGDSEAVRKLGLEGDAFQPQEYLIRAEGDTIVLLGRDWRDTPANRAEIGCDTNLRSLSSWRETINYGQVVGREQPDAQRIELPGPLDDQGTCYAAYDFLERCCGVRWYGPTPLGLVTPKQRSLTIDPIELRRTPSMLHRHGQGGNWPLVCAQWNNPTDAQRSLFYRRLRFGGEKWAGMHSFSSFQDRFLKKSKEHPELWERSRPDFFAVGWENEGDWRQLCLTNPDLVRQVAQDARDYFDGKGLKGRQPASGDYFTVVPADSDHWCKCDRCQAVLAPGKSRDKPGYFESGTASDYVFGFVNAVAKEVGRTHPDKFIATLAYHVYSYPPTFTLEPNVAVAPCVVICYGYQQKIIANIDAFYSEWKVDRTRRFHLWNYFHHPMERALIGGWRCFPVFMPDVISDWMKRYQRDGVRGYYLCGIGEQVDYYLFMQMAFNTDIEYTSLIDEFFGRYFGPAGEPMKRFYYRISEINRQEGKLGTTPELSWERLGTAERMEELGGLIARAVELAQTEPEKQRVETWRKGVWNYMVKGRAQHFQRKRAHDKKEVAIRLYATGVDGEGKLLEPHAVDPHWRLAKKGDAASAEPAYAAMADTSPDCPWPVRSDASGWITCGAKSLDAPPGRYVYEQTFSMEGMDPLTASIVGRVMADDIVEAIEINGQSIGPITENFATWQEFVVMDDFLPGSNTLRITVRNHGAGPNPHGLRVELSGSADRPK